jgi:nitrogen fixation NifU-like protein
MWINIFIGAGILLVVVLAWFLAYYWLTPHLKEPDGHARVTGACQDTMEISLRFKDNRVVDSSYWTSGCVYSLNCVAAASQMAKGKTPDEALESVSADRIQAAIGGLPRDHMHCATLAADTLEKALGDYVRKKTHRDTEDAHLSAKKSHPA